MEFEKGQKVKINESYVKELLAEEKNCKFGGIMILKRHLDRGNNPVEIIEVRPADRFNREYIKLDLNNPNGYGFNVCRKEIKPINNKVKKL